MGLSVSQGHFGGLIRGHSLYAGTKIVLLKSIKEVRSALLKNTVQTKQPMIVLKCTKQLHVLRTWYDQESIIYGLLV